MIVISVPSSVKDESSQVTLLIVIWSRSSVTSKTCILSGGVQATYDIFVRKIISDPATSPFLGYLSNSSALTVQYQLDITLISPVLWKHSRGNSINSFWS